MSTTAIDKQKKTRRKLCSKTVVGYHAPLIESSWSKSSLV